MVGLVTTHEVRGVYSSRFGSISLPAQPPSIQCVIPGLRSESMESATVFTTALLLVPGHGLPGSRQRAALRSLLGFAGGAGGSKRVPMPCPCPCLPHQQSPHPQV